MYEPEGFSLFLLFAQISRSHLLLRDAGDTLCNLDQEVALTFFPISLDFPSSSHAPSLRRGQTCPAAPGSTGPSPPGAGPSGCGIVGHGPG
jgi:hypothetical protein